MMPGRSKKYGVSALLLAGIAAGAFLSSSIMLQLANARISAEIGRTPGLQAATVEADLRHGRIVLGQLQYSGNGTSIRAERLVLSTGFLGFWAISPAMALDGAASADNLVIESGVITYKIKHLEASGTSLSAQDLAALVDSNSSVPIATRLQSLSAASILAPEVIGTIKLGDIGETITYSDVRLANIVAGKIAAASIADTAIVLDSGKSGPISVKMPNTTARNVDLVLIARMLTASRTDENEPLKPLYDNFSADGFVLTGLPKGTFTVGKISGQGFKGRAMAVSYFDLFNKLGAATANHAEPDQKQKQQFASGYADLVRSIEVGSVEVRDVNLAVQEKTGPVQFKLARYAMNGLAGGRLAEVVYEGLVLDSAKAKLKFGNFSIRGFDFKPLLALADAYAANGGSAVEDPAAARNFIPSIDHIGMTGIDLDAEAPDGKTGNMPGGARNAFTLSELALDAGGYILGIPTTATVVVDHLKMDATGLLDKPDMKAVAALGFKSIDLSSKFDLGWNEAANDLMLKSFGIEFLGAGKITFAATLGNVTKDVFSPQAEIALAAGMGALAKKAEVWFNNQGIVDKIIEAEARKAKQTPEAFRKMVVGGIAAVVPSVLGGGPATDELVAALSKFIASPQNIHITATSADGLGIGDVGLLNKPMELLKRVQIKATANE